MGMDSKNILAALKTGAISIEDAASSILKMKGQGSSKAPLEISCGDIKLKKIAGGYHKVIITGPGSIDGLKIVASDVPTVEPHQVRIAVKAFSLNFADLLCVRGLYPSMPAYPFTPGLEVSGIVTKVGDGVKAFQPGDLVVAMAGKNLGGHATQLTCPGEQVIHKPDSLSFEEACALPVVAITMMIAFDKAKVQWGEKVLIQTATGGTGLMAVQLAKYYGATIFATAGSDHKLAYLAKLGVPHGINYLKTDFQGEIDRLTGGRGVDVVINTLPGDAIQKGLNCLSPEGRYIELAMTGIRSAKAIDLSVLNNNQTFYSIDPGKLKRPEIVRNHFMEMMRLANQGILRATICKTFLFNEIKDAYRYLENRKNIGKIVVTVPEEYQYEEQPTLVKSGIQIDACGIDERSVAIIGMSGRFAGADDLRIFWENLAEGKNSIRDVPEWRWDANQPDSPGNDARDGQVYCKRGGFLEDIDKFDPLFFNISPAEAEYMDPQQRLFLEESWKTLEDAGYAPKALSGRKCGVFVGVGKGDYLGKESGSWETANAYRLMGTSPSILAARISYILNLTGPSLAIDTACSSALVAIHQAYQSIVNNECEMALAGGVCILTTKDLLIMAGKAGMLSPSGQCRTFDNGADGFVTGEGGGVLLLKSLSKAIEDGDYIRAVIRGGGFNQDGRTNGITAPSAKSQIKLEKEVYDRYGINPESVSYVEAHGTGTKLGDPIEVSALTEVYKKYTDKKQYCAIGSVKTNIGHTLAAAGAASVIKVALALNYKKIPPSVNFTMENEHINFRDSPFFVNTKLRDWKSVHGYPLRAAVSSFGFSGTNVHMIMDGYQDTRPAPDTGSGPVIFVLSAKTSQRLKAYARKMAVFLDGWPEGEETSFNIADIAYTSQVGREAMTHRLAVIVTCVEELRDKLKRFIAQEDAIEGLVFARVERKVDPLWDSGEALAGDSALQEAIEQWVKYKNGSQLVSLWTGGSAVDWNTLYGSVKPRRISLPTYPFERERYWMTDDSVWNGDVKIQKHLKLHPLVHENTSDFSEQRFSSTFTGDEFFLADHLIGGRRMLPGVAYLEMARAAVIYAAALPRDAQVRILFKNVVWARPVTVVDAPVCVHITLFPEEGGQIAYEVCSNPDDGRSGETINPDDITLGGMDTGMQVHSRGVILLQSNDEEVPVCDIQSNTESEIESIKARCTNKKNHEVLYGTGAEGKAPASFMCIKELFLNNNKAEALALLELPSHLDDTSSAYGLHPSVLNGAFETAVFGLHPDIKKGETVIGLFEKGEAAIPYSLDEIEIINPVLPKKCYAHALEIGDGDMKIFNIRMLDTSGNLLARLDHFAVRSLPASSSLQFGVKTKLSTFHPMIDGETQWVQEPEFLKRFTGNEFYFTDHVVVGKRVLPGVAYLEMARAAVSFADVFNDNGVSESQVSGIVLKNIAWTRPMVLEKDPLDVHIRIFPKENGLPKKHGEMGYEIFTLPAGHNTAVDPLVHSTGTARLMPPGESPGLDIESIKAQCTQGRLGAKECYDAYENMGLSYGPGHKGIQTLYVGKGQLLARLVLPPAVFDQDGPFTLHPGLMDSALQASIGLMIGPELTGPEPVATGLPESAELHPSVPFALERIEIYGPCVSTMWAYLKSSAAVDDKVQKLDIDICDDNGRICVRLQGFSSKEFKDPETGTLLLKPSWREKEVDEGDDFHSYGQHVVVLCETEGIDPLSLRKAMKGLKCIALKSKEKNIQNRFESHAIQIFDKIKKILQKKTDGKRFVQLVIPDNGENHLYMGLAGLLKTADMENSTLFCQMISLNGSKNFSDSIIEILKDNARCPGDKVVRYEDNKRLVASFESTGVVKEEISEHLLPWKDRGIYLITGGAGGLGLIFAREIASRVKNPVIVVTGRSKPGPEQQSSLAALENEGVRVEYQRADVRKKADVKKLMLNISKTFGDINGIIHSAGIIRDNVLIKKTRQEFKEVLGPKVKGLVNLDQASMNMNLDFFIMFSSGAGALGNIGQADYACANAFMDAYAEYRDGLVTTKKRSGKTLSINWPLWQSGGMRVDEETEKMLRINYGMTALGTVNGILAFYHTLALGFPRALVAQGWLAKMRQKLLSPGLSDPHSGLKKTSSSLAEPQASGLLETVKRRLVADVSKMMKIQMEKINPEEDLGSYGFDSITLTELTNKLNLKYGLELPPTLFFEYPTLAGFATYLVGAHPSILAEHFAEKSIPKTFLPPKIVKDIPIPQRSRSRFARVAVAKKKKTSTATGVTPVAIVGISGKFPMAENVDGFWKNLAAGRNCITEIPADRWDWRRFLEDGQGEDNTGIKWGGFIDGVRDFDPMFFRISPREAELMDPQQRLMMLFVWKAMEDAGITPQVLSERSTGVFISPGINEYMHLPSYPQDDPYAPTGIAISAIPNRISYAFNLLGPSEYCETACSSALVALHRGIISMRLGECEQAIIGAVNLLLSPGSFNGTDAYGHLSPKGRAKSFQADADGYVRGEGVGAMIIKPLDRAISDNDQIYAVIRGTGIAHGGKGMSLTAPTGRGMKAAMEQAYKNSGVNPETISYIEAHGTATPMGDAVEINTLKSGYSEISEKGYPLYPGSTKMPVYISSLKPCVGHLEIASGMAALIKVAMALKHKTIPGLPGFERLNENISLEGSRFKFSAENHPWKSLIGENGSVLPRRAAINSYGFGGVNAHVIIEEYVDKRTRTDRPNDGAAGKNPVIFVLSAKNQDRLKVYAENMAQFLEENDAELQDIAYTLQTGRGAMEYRLAMVVTHKNELVEGLKAFAGSMGKDGACSPVRVFTGNSEMNLDPDSQMNSETDLEIAQLLSVEEGDVRAKKPLTDNNLEKLADYWVRGFDLPWESIYQKGRYSQFPPVKLSLPGYPFESHRCWIEIPDDVKKEKPARKTLGENPDYTLVKPAADVRQWLTQTLCAMLKLSENEIRPDQEMGQWGFDSYSGVRLISRIKDAYCIKVPLERLLEYNTVDKLARYMTENINNKQQIDNTAINPETIPVKADDSVVDTEITENKIDASALNESQDEDVNLDDLSEAELDRLLQQHLEDE